MVLRGACLSRMSVRVELKRRRYDSSEVGEEETRGEETISDMNCLISIVRNLRISLVIGLGLLHCGIVIEQSMAK